MSCLCFPSGLHSGPAVSGIVGKIRRRFCIFGNTVNMASRTETSCPPGCVQITEDTYRLAVPHLGPDEVLFKDRGQVVVKGAAAPMQMFLARRGGGGRDGDGDSGDESMELGDDFSSSGLELSGYGDERASASDLY